MAAETETFTLNFKDGTSGASEKAAQSLERLRGSIEKDTAALRQMESAFRRMNKGSAVNVAAARELQSKISSQKDKISEAQSAYVSLGGTFDKVAKKQKIQSSNTNELTAVSDKLKTKLSGKLGLLGVAAAFAAVVAAATAAAAAVIAFGLAAADARREERIQLEGLTRLKFSYFGLAQGIRRTFDSAGFLQAQVDKVSSSVALGRGKVLEYARSLQLAGLRGGNLQAALEGVSIVASTQGEREAAAFKAFAMQAALTGQSVRALADDVKARLGPLAEKQMLGLSVQTRKLKEDFDRLFDDLPLDGFLRTLRSFTELFSQSTVSGRALKRILENVISPLNAGFNKVAPVARAFWKGLIIGALLLENAWLRVRKKLSGVFGEIRIDKMMAIKAAALAGVSAMLLFAAAVGVAVIGLLTAFGPLIAVGAVIFGLIKTMQSVADFITGIDWSTLGSRLIDGLVQGIKAGIRKVADAVKGVGRGAVAAFESVLGIRSPSRVFMARGFNVSAGISRGVRAGASVAVGATQQLATQVASVQVQPPPAFGQVASVSPSVGVAARRASAPSEARQTPGRVAISIGEIVVSAPEGKEPREFGKAVFDSLREQLANELEGVALEIGAI